MSILDSQKEVLSSLIEKDKELYKDDEQDLIQLSKDTRKDLVLMMTKGGVPERSGDIRVLNEVLSSMDAQVNSLANNRLKVKASDDNADTVSMVRELINSVKSKQRGLTVNHQVSLNDSYIPTDTVPGELDINPSKLSLDEFED